ncbi:MAG: rhomboid family intramembrane serine protease [Candidatus Helarchaeota archaeon]
MAEEPKTIGRKFPILTVTIIMINVVVYLITTLIFSTNAFYLDDANPYIQALIFYPSEFFQMKHWYTLFTSQFLHADPIHIISNMYFVLIFFDDLEYAFGKLTALVFYLFSGVIAGMFFAVMQLLFAVLFSPTNLNAVLSIGAVGASGAIFGVLAGYGFSFPNRLLRIPGFTKPIKAKYFVLFYVMLEVIYTVSALVPGLAPGDSVAHAAHVGGFLGGLAFTYLYKIFNSKRYIKIKTLQI